VSPVTAPAGLDDPAPVAPAPAAREAVHHGTFLHVSRARLKPGDHLVPGGQLPSKATSQGHAWYASQGPEVAWRMDRVWLWPSLAQAREWMDIDDKAIYEVRAVDPEPLDCCTHTSPDPDCETGGDCGYGQQWHAADAVVIRVVQKRNALDALTSLMPFGRREED
jgi:hypothetical protein